jgi:hypothetical protein
MSNKISREDKISDAYLVIGSQYYVLARYCAEINIQPVGVTLFHHAIEMLLKGFLSKQMTKDELKRIGHNLDILWDKFMMISNSKESNSFNNVIPYLNKVEDLRYPDAMIDEGFLLNIRIGTPIPLDLPGTNNLPNYSIDVLDIDDIVSTVFSACKIPVDIYFKDIPRELSRCLPSSLL